MSTGGSCTSTPSSAVKDRSVALSELLEHIHGYYKAALDRLPVEETPALIPRLLDGGVCFGLLDPISNIIANTVRSFEPLPETHAAEEPAAAEEGERSRRGTKRKAAAEEEARMIRDEAMSEIVTDAGSIYCLPPILRDARMRKKKRTVAQRSLEGLVTFLVCYFRHLPVEEALHYLLLAKADLLAAVHLVECVRGTAGRSCPISSPTTVIALRCAAIAASHPAPANLAARSLSLASRLDQVPQLLTIDGRLSSDAINRLYHKLLEAPVIEQLAVSPKPLQLATVRLNRCIKGNSSLERFPLEFTKTLRYLLLHKIHALYLKAIALLPRDALRRRHHRGLLKAGCCYGPADNPVTNIILNTIWYDTAFPPHVQFEVDVISTKSLGRVECRSLNGLLALLGNLFPALAEHDAMVHLLRSDASLQDVIFRAMQNQDMSSSSYGAAYKAAAEAARHPQPDAQAEFSMSTSPKMFHIVESALRVNRTLKLSEVELITSYFSQKSYPGKSVTSVLKLTPHATKIVSYNKRNFFATQDFISRKVEAALQKYAKEKGIEHELHIICGVNLEVPENGKHSYILNEEGYPYSHVNFLARTKGCHLDDMASNLFFLECSNDENGLDGLPSCCTVLVSPSDSGRCFHCEYEGIKIVHPDFGTYRGRETDFEEMACGKRKVDNELLIGFGEIRMEFVGMVSDDSVYSDPATDADFAECMNYLARREEKEEAFLSGECSR
ncbi:unnamed protein product [Urochloa decumbens]|uniref:Uncharacterized protein n=1 Tax=Urochloa decumbens TaxID=240449 RepID=A0ABC8YGU7_9POAL